MVQERPREGQNLGDGHTAKQVPKACSAHSFPALEASITRREGEAGTLLGCLLASPVGDVKIRTIKIRC